MKKKISRKESTALIHNFNLKFLIDFVKHLVSSEDIKNFKQSYNSSSFFGSLKKQTPLIFNTFKYDFKDPLYRVTCFHPTSISGNLAYGGRFNVGGSQLDKRIDIKPFAALYLSTSLQCAEDEYAQGTPLGPKDVKYELTPAKIFELWDIEKVIQSLNFPNLSTLINQGPIFNSWGYCKVPMQSQILAFWLKEIGGDGIFFKSIQSTIGSYCVALFVEDDEESKTLFSQVKTI